MESESNSPPSVVKCRKCGCSCSPLVSSSTGGAWLRSVKRKHDEFEKGNRFFVPGFEIFNVARVQIETECAALRETVGSQQQSIHNLQIELEEERNASSSAANEAMSMILRLQREKAEVQMEARQFKRFAEEKSAHDQQEISSMEDLLYKREQAIQSLTCEVQAYKHRMLSYGLGESEADGEGSGLSHNQSAHDNFDDHDELPSYDYPPLRCNPGNNFEVENEVIDIEKYAFGETPRDHLKNLEYRISQMEKSPKKNQLDGDFPSGKNILEKVIVGQSPRWASLSGRISTDSMIIKETASDIPAESPMRCNSVKKVDYFSYPEEYNPRKLGHVSEGDDDMTNDRIYTIDSIHTGIKYNSMKETKSGVGFCEDYMNTPKEFFNRIDVSDPADIKKLYVRLQALEADRESMRQAILSMRTDKAQLVLLKEIAQHLSKDMGPESSMPVKRSPVIKTFSFISVFKWFASFVFWRKKGQGRRSKYFFELSAQNLGLLMLLDNSPEMRQWRCLTSTQV